MHWDECSPRIFISHASHDHELALDLRAGLACHGVSTFVAPQSVAPLANWAEGLEDAIRTCHAVVAVITRRFSDSPWSNQEVGLAMGCGKLVVPVSIDGAPPGYLSLLQAVGGRDRSAASIAADIYRVLGTHGRTGSVVAELLVRRVAESSSLAQEGKLLQQIRCVDWSGEAAIALLEATARNVKLTRGFKDHVQLCTRRGAGGRL